MVTRIRLELRSVAPPVIPVTTAVAIWVPPEARAGLPAARPSARPYTARQRCTARLRLHTRPAEPHELAFTTGVDMVNGGHRVAGDESVSCIDVKLADGSCVSNVEAAALARHSAMLATLLSSPGWRESASATKSARREVVLAAHDPQTVRAALAWVAAAQGAPQRAAAQRLMEADMVVETARLAHYLELEPLLRAALCTLRGALDAGNAGCVMGLARELGDATLEQVTLPGLAWAVAQAELS